MARRELEYPTGRPLYTYRVTTEEFSELESILQERMKVYLKLASLAEVARSLEFFPALFMSCIPPSGGAATTTGLDFLGIPF